MVRRKPGREWSAAGLPRLRDRMVAAQQNEIRDLIHQTEHQSPGTDRAQVDDVHSVTERWARDTAALRSSELYWVAPPMCEVVTRAEATLPEYTPALAVPSPDGLLLFGAPPGQIGGLTIDAVRWISTFSTIEITWLTRHVDTCSIPALPGLPITEGGESVLIGGLDAVREPGVNHVDRRKTPHVGVGVEAGELIERLTVSTWLLMGLPRMADTRIQREDTGRIEPASDRPPTVRDVTIIDLRRTEHPPSDHDRGHPGREYTRRWWVGGHWRQQACGPGREQRRPTWIAPHIKGPDGAPLLDMPRVHVWRR